MIESDPCSFGYSEKQRREKKSYGYVRRIFKIFKENMAPIFNQIGEDAINCVEG